MSSKDILNKISNSYLKETNIMVKHSLLNMLLEELYIQNLQGSWVNNNFNVIIKDIIINKESQINDVESVILQLKNLRHIRNDITHLKPNIIASVAIMRTHTHNNQFVRNILEIITDILFEHTTELKERLELNIYLLGINLDNYNDEYKGLGWI